MKKIILLILCLFLCSISIKAKTIANYKNKQETSPITKYKIKQVNGDNQYKFYKFSFSIKGKLVDRKGNPLANREIEIYSINKSFYSSSEYSQERHGKKFIIHTNAEGFFSKTFDIVPNQGKGNPKIQDAEIHFVFCNNYDYYYMEIDYRNKTYSESFMDGWMTKSVPKSQFEESTIRYKLTNGQNIYSMPNPIRIIYKYPFDKFIKIIPYDKNDNAQLEEIEDSKSNVIVLDTVDLSAEYFIEKKKKENIIEEATKMLRQEKIYDDVNELIIEADGSIRDNWKEIINSKIKEVKEERKRKEQKRQDEIEKFKHDPDLHTVKSQIGRCPNCYRFSLIISLIMRTGDPYHQWILFGCTECAYVEQKFIGF